MESAESVGTRTRTNLWQRLLRRHLITVATASLLVLAIAMNAILQSDFFTPSVIRSNLTSFVPLVVAAVAQTIVILAGGIDLSLGVIITLVDVVVVRLIGTSSSPTVLALCLGAGLAVGALAGLVNGIAVAVIRLQPIVATFATSFIWSGLSLLVMPRPGGQVPTFFYRGYRQVFLGIPVAAWIIAGVLVLWLIIKRLPLGRYIYAVGGNQQAAYATGINESGVKIASYVLCGVFAAIAGLCIVADTATGDPFVGAPFTLTSITAVVIGGTRLTGGVGDAGNSVIGAIILGLVTNIIFFANVPSFYQEFIFGVIVVAALAGAGMLTTRRRSS
ncbi:MAG TPA: ABC transporter permease [Firmicutes bacterium]|nr:ABC transporter permease [Bacillota bacterium]